LVNKETKNDAVNNVGKIMVFDENHRKADKNRDEKAKVIWGNHRKYSFR